MATPNTNRTRVIANYARLMSSFALGLIWVRLLLGIGEQVYGLIALLGAGTGIAASVKEAVRASMVPELGAAYHSKSPDRLKQTYNAALILSPAAGLVTLIGFVVLAFAITWINIPGELVWAARVFVAAKAVQIFFAVALAPTFNMYMVTERMVAYNAWTVVERLADVVAALAVIAFCTKWDVGSQIVAYAILTSAFATLSQVISSLLILGDEPILRPSLWCATRGASRSLLRSVGWNASVVLAMNLYLRVDMFIMNLFFGLFGNLVFGIAGQLTSYVRQLTMGIVAGVDAVAARLSSDENQQAIQRLMRQSTRLQAIVIFPTAVTLLFLAEPLLLLWVGSRVSEPETTLPVVATMVRVMIIGVVARSLSEGWMHILAGAGKVRSYAPMVLMFAFANPVLACVLIYWTSSAYSLYIPAAVFSALLLVVHLLCIPMVVTRACGVSMLQLFVPHGRPVFATIVSTPLLFLANVIHTSRSTSLLVGTLSFTVVYFIACYLFVLERHERNSVNSFVLRRAIRFSPNL